MLHGDRHGEAYRPIFTMFNENGMKMGTLLGSS
jgi:hypothetical protein